MTLNYDYSEADWLNYQLYYCTQSGQIAKARRAYILLLSVMVLETLLSVLIRRFDLAFIVGALAAAFGYLAWRLPALYRKAFQRQLQRGDLKPLFTANELVIEPGGIRTRTRLGETFHYWEGVQQLVETEDYIYIRFAAAVNIIVPKRAFTSALQGLQFLKLAEEYRQAATGKPIPTLQRGAWWTQGTQVVEVQTQRQ